MRLNDKPCPEKIRILLLLLEKGGRSRGYYNERVFCTCISKMRREITITYQENSFIAKWQRSSNEALPSPLDKQIPLVANAFCRLILDEFHAKLSFNLCKSGIKIPIYSNISECLCYCLIISSLSLFFGKV